MSSIIFDGSSPANADTVTTHTEYRIQDELFFHYSSYNLRDLSQRLYDRVRDLKENARKKFNNLLAIQGKSRAVISNAKEQQAKLKEQQALRNRIQKDRLSDLRQRNQDLSRLRTDLKLKSQLNR